jgi:CobQ-like glutamine amidotransferase family enzyme
MGGAQDTQQEIVEKDLKDTKGKLLQKAIEDEIPGLYICGAYQFLGNYYKDADGKKIEGLGIFDLYTVNPGINTKRLIGNTFIKTSSLNSITSLVGFENHGGRTYLGKNIQPLGKVVKGFGNNGEDGMEGAIYKNSIGSYFHGPILPKNPQLADWLIQTALEKKYKAKIELKPLDDALETKAHDFIAKRLGVEL